MPDLFPNVPVYLLCGLVVAGASLIYATVGFGAGMFSVALLALILPDLQSTVATLLVLTFVTEVCVLANAWRQARFRLLLGLLPTTAVGMWLGARLLVVGDTVWLKHLLGVTVLAAGAWFLYQQARQAARPESAGCIAPAAGRVRWKPWPSLPVGLAAGVLGGLFGTGGPPVIVFLRSYNLDKSGFRATILWYFFLMSFIRGGTYLHSGLLGVDELLAASWLVPPVLVGTLLGTAIHKRISERQFGLAVSVLLMILGLLLAVGGGK